MSKTRYHNQAVVIDTAGNILRHHAYEDHIPEHALLKRLGKFYATTGRVWLFDGVLYVEVEHG